jgi:hypothetical protein
MINGTGMADAIARIIAAKQQGGQGTQPMPQQGMPQPMPPQAQAAPRTDVWGKMMAQSMQSMRGAGGNRRQALGGAMGMGGAMMGQMMKQRLTGKGGGRTPPPPVA